ncbi:zonular occludens toxin domain-containing protein [Pseudomonas helleri]|uniref:zonular occludens toxin domain-containing protein n=1 Tax=Pseudomonas helleri TaxID=1608996 RepID=UPI00242C36EC|nr:zonular occludens toxin domain-containing protein [Pseudomonas helleri]
MAIHGYVGKPGSGKSYGVVERVVIPSLKQGRHVVTNIPLMVDDLLADFGGTVEILPHDWWERPDLNEFVRNGCVLILDELWRRWPSGQTVQKANINDKALLAEHRHMVDDKGNSMRIVLVTQDLSQLASWARTLIETTFVIKKFTKKTYRVNSYFGVVTGDSPPKSKLIRQAAGKFNPDVFRYYRSATKSQTGDVGDESVADKTGSFLRSYTLWAFIVLFVVGLSFGVPAVTSFFKAPLTTKVQQPKDKTPSTLKKPQSQTKLIKPQVIYSSNWRLSGFVHPSQTDPNTVRDSSVAVLVSPYGRTRYIAFSGCRYFSDFKEAYCDIDGERITTWTAGGSSSQIPFIGGLGGGTAERSVSGTGG